MPITIQDRGATYYVVGVYDDGIATILAGPVKMTEARRKIAWQGAGYSSTRWHICRPDPDDPGIMVDHISGCRLEIVRGALTAEAHTAQVAAIWPKS
jgi:hypothetical protein